MNIGVIASNWKYPPSDGVQKQLLQCIEALRNAGHQVEILALGRNIDVQDRSIGFDLGGGRVIDQGGGYVRMSFWSLAAIWSKGVICLFHPLLRATRSQILRWSSSKDAIYIQGITLAWLTRYRGSAKIIWGPVDPYVLRFHRLIRFNRDASIIRRARLRLSCRVALLIERFGFRYAEDVYLCGYDDARFVHRFYRRRDVVAIPLFPDHVDISGRPSRKGETVVVWADCRFDYLRESARRCLESIGISSMTAGVPIVVVGRGVDALMAETLKLNASIQLIDWVDDIDTMLREAAAVIIPDMVGTGIKNRTLHALSLGCCVIGLPVAFQSIPVDEGRSALLVREWTSLPDIIARIVSKEVDSRKIGDEAADVVRNHFDPTRILRAWEDLLLR